jgi:hypothetical protein
MFFEKQHYLEKKEKKIKNCVSFTILKCDNDKNTWQKRNKIKISGARHINNIKLTKQKNT